MLKVAEKFRSVLRRKGITDSPGPAGAGSPVGELTYMLNSKKITEYLTPGHHVHLVGIGGVSMRPLGLVLKGMGMEVTGSDMNASVSTDELIEQGIPVAIGHRAENIEGADCIIRTAAAHHGGAVLIDQPEGVGTRITMTMSIRQSKQATLRSNVLRVDYAGERDHGLIELSECLPTELYE